MLTRKWYRLFYSQLICLFAEFFHGSSLAIKWLHVKDYPTLRWLFFLCVPLTLSFSKRKRRQRSCVALHGSDLKGGQVQKDVQFRNRFLLATQTPPLTPPMTLWETGWPELGRSQGCVPLDSLADPLSVMVAA